MTTQITNKQVKVITDTNFNNTKIVNAKIDASENEITGVSTELYAGNNISIDGATISAIVPTKVSELDNDSQYITNVVDDLVNYTTTVNLANVALSGNYNDLINKPLIDSALSDNSTNAVQNKVITNALDEKANLVKVTDSGSSLPSISGYQNGDTFLNTTDKKIYTIQTKYKWSDGVQTSYAPTIDFSTGVATGFYSPVGGPPKMCYKTVDNSYVWEGNKTYNIHFKLGENNSGVKYGIFTTSLSNSNTYSTKSVSFYIYNNAVYYSKSRSQMGPQVIDLEEKLFDFNFEINTEYYLYINKENENGSITLSNIGYNQNVLVSSNFVTNDYVDTATAYFIVLGGASNYLGINSSIYLLDTFGDFLTVDTVNWDSGVSLVDSTEYMDITNGIFYLYFNNTLFNNIPSFAEITGQPTDNVNLANELTRIESLTITNSSNIILETSNRQTADNNLQQQIDAITAASDVTDIVGTHAQLESYDTSTLANNSIIKVLQDETQNNETTYYRWVITNNVGAWVLIGEEGPYYTKSQADEMFVPQTRTINGIGLSNNITLTKSNIGLGNVDNTSDVNKPISTATQNALNNKQDLLPSQSGQNGKFLTTNGTSLSWAEVQGGGGSFSQTDYYEMAEVENMVNMTGTISIDLDKYLAEVSEDRWLETYIYDGTNWKNYDEQVVDFSTLGIDGSSATFVSGSSFDVSSVCLRNKTEFSVSSVLTINALYLNGLLMLKKDYSVGSNNRITFNGYILKATDAISIM